MSNLKPEILQLPYRKMRADALVAWVMQIVSPYIDEQLPNGPRDCARALHDAFYDSGVEIISDADRAAAGLAQRGEHGLTRQELAIMEARHIEAMLKPIQIVVPKGDAEHLRIKEIDTRG